MQPICGPCAQDVDNHNSHSTSVWVVCDSEHAPRDVGEQLHVVFTDNCSCRRWQHHKGGEGGKSALSHLIRRSRENVSATMSVQGPVQTWQSSACAWHTLDHHCHWPCHPCCAELSMGAP
jgi:hypothetical protein